MAYLRLLRRHPLEEIDTQETSVNIYIYAVTESRFGRGTSRIQAEGITGRHLRQKFKR
jgi:hypothetical protein